MEAAVPGKVVIERRRRVFDDWSTAKTCESYTWRPTNYSVGSSAVRIDDAKLGLAACWLKSRLQPATS
jgi:hypothetical protein